MFHIGSKVVISSTASREEATFRGKKGTIVGFAMTAFGEVAKVRMDGPPLDGLILRIFPESLRVAP